MKADEPEHCSFAIDRVKDDPATTEWKRAARIAQGRWREKHHHPIGAHPYDGERLKSGKLASKVGSRLELAFARSSGDNFINDTVRKAVAARIANPEKHQMLREDRLWADLLSSMPLCFNLFGDLTADASRAANAIQTWWPDAPRGNVHVRFEHSPGRTDPLFLGNKSAFDVAFEIETADTRAIIGVETKYHEHAETEERPKEKALARYAKVTERSHAFAEDWRARLIGTPLQQIWQDHLLVLSMLQHPSKKWSWGRFVLVYPAANPSFAKVAADYRAVLRDTSTFEARTIEDLIAAPGVLDEQTVSALRERYFAV